MISNLTYLCCGLPLPFRICLPNEIQIFLVQHSLLLLALSSSSLLVFSTAAFPLLWLLIFVINDEALAYLVECQRKAHGTWYGFLRAYSTSSLLIVVVFLLFAGVVQLPIYSRFARNGFAGLFIERLIVLFVVELGLAVDQISHAHLCGVRKMVEGSRRWGERTIKYPRGSRSLN
jgi:hypothetical protein